MARSWRRFQLVVTACCFIDSILFGYLVAHDSYLAAAPAANAVVMAALSVKARLRLGRLRETAGDPCRTPRRWLA